jgi:glycosyltransferase involved in cell wall biosynthesis
MSELRVVHTVPALFGARGTTGGAERYALELARYMADRVDTTLVTFGDRAREERAGALRIQVLERRWRVRGQENNPFAFRLLAAIARADVVHCHQQRVVASTAAAAAARALGKRAFVSDLGGGGWDLSAYLPTDRLYHGHLHISEYSRHIKGHSGRPWAHVIYGGVDEDTFSPAPAGDAAARRPVLYVGRLLPHKGVNDLVEAIPPGMPLELIGKPYDERYLADLRRLASGKDVTFRHDCGEAELVAAYRGAACVVLPSVYRTMYGTETTVPELLGQTLLEGMACGLPAICTDVASMPEVVEDGVTGFVVPPNDPAALGAKIAWLAEHPSQAAAMGRAGRQRVLERFRWPAVVDRCLAIYASSGARA